MKICIVTIDHGKPELTSKLFASVVSQTPHDIQTHFAVLENSAKVNLAQYDFLKSAGQLNLTAEIKFMKNDGYFGTASNFLQSFDFGSFDWIIVCNNDLTVESNFFDVLSKRKMDLSGKLLVCPSVFERGIDINPLSRNKYSQLKRSFWNVYYKFRLFALAYEGIRLSVSKFKFYVRSKISNDSATEGNIYLGYGAFYLINPVLIHRIGKLPAETFLYQEESVICSYARNFGSWPYFVPSLKVHHESHATLKYIGFRRDYELRRDAWWKTLKYLS